MERILNEVRNFIKEHNLISENDKVGCALSGGTDSIFMTYILKKLSIEMNFKILAIHVNHMLRGNESLKDEEFSRKFCELNNIEFKSYRVDVKKYSENNKVSIEMAGRTLRYEIFEKLKNDLIITKCALAHHADDDVETILMRIFRGTGIRGIEGIKKIRNGFYIRPILFLRRKQHIEKFLQDNSIDYCVDKSNFSNDYLRNKLRLSIIPNINENFLMDITNNVLHLKEISRNDNEFFDNLINDYLNKYVTLVSDGVLINKECLTLHKSILFRLIRKSIEIFCGDINDINLKHIKYIINIGNTNKSKIIQIKKNLYCINDLKELKLVREIPMIEKEHKTSHILLNTEEINKFKMRHIKEITKEICFLGNNIRVKFSLEDNFNNNKVSSLDDCKYFSFDNVNNNVILRNRIDGDFFKPFGMEKYKKLKSFLIDQKAKNRDKIPIICFDDNISWVFNYRNSEDYKVLNTTKIIVKIKLEYI